MNNKNYFIALNQMNNIGPCAVKQLIAKWPDLSQLFNRSLTHLVNIQVPGKIAQAIASFDLNQIEADLRWEENDNHHILTWCDPRYPTLLKEIPDPPIVLYAIGDLSSLKQPTVAMVGTRKPSVTGRETARKWSFELAGKGLTIVSGLALGVDAQAHQGCLDAGGKTIAVMGTGIDCIYPRAHRDLAQLIGQNGLLLSEFPLKSPPIAGHFPRRNRIISGLSLLTLVVEAATKSGSLITAQCALDQNRDVLAIPGSIHNPNARGCHYLLQQGAKLVTSSEDVLGELGLDYEPLLSVITTTRLADENANLVEYLGFETTTVDHIIVRSGLTLESVMCGLANLELQGLIKMVPGGYTRCI
jgi:DNA processing protein